MSIDYFLDYTLRYIKLLTARANIRGGIWSRSLYFSSSL